MKNCIVLVVAILVLASCSTPTDIDGFNEQAWQSDKDGCEGLRFKLKDELELVKDQIKGLNNDEVISVLGKPNKTLLDKRNQKYFIYAISPSKNCPNHEQGAPSELSLRFSAIGLVYEVLIY